MLIIEHRVNTAAQLALVPAGHGIEIDIRDYDGDLRLVHDPLLGGESLEAFLKGYRHAFCAFNVKCDGLETQILELAARYGVKDFFFLDCAAPTLVKLARSGVKQLAPRFSEFEPIESALAFAGLANWVWVDCFTRLPLDAVSYAALKRHFKICLVSPELQGHGRSAIPAYRAALQGMPIDAVCTDFPEDWA
ncbi:MAG: hypothetical protein V4498_05215 [candidate division FCPU426 bacterium]